MEYVKTHTSSQCAKPMLFGSFFNSPIENLTILHRRDNIQCSLHNLQEPKQMAM